MSAASLANHVSNECNYSFKTLEADVRNLKKAEIAVRDRVEEIRRRLADPADGRPFGFYQELFDNVAFLFCRLQDCRLIADAALPNASETEQDSIAKVIGSEGQLGLFDRTIRIHEANIAVVKRAAFAEQDPKTAIRIIEEILCELQELKDADQSPEEKEKGLRRMFSHIAEGGRGSVGMGPYVVRMPKEMSHAICAPLARALLASPNLLMNLPFIVAQIEAIRDEHLRRLRPEDKASPVEMTGFESIIRASNRLRLVALDRLLQMLKDSEVTPQAIAEEAAHLHQTVFQSSVSGSLPDAISKTIHSVSSINSGLITREQCIEMIQTHHSKLAEHIRETAFDVRLAALYHREKLISQMRAHGGI